MGSTRDQPVKWIRENLSKSISYLKAFSSVVSLTMVLSGNPAWVLREYYARLCCSTPNKTG